MSNSRLEHKLDIIMMKLNYITNLLEYGRQPRIPRSTNYPNPFQYTNTTNTANNTDEIFEFSFSAPTTNTPNLLSSLLNINPLVPNRPENRRLTHREIMDNTTIFVATTEHTSEKCSISRENFNEGDIIRKINQCGHMFLSENLEKWLTTNNTCPLCRINVVQSTEENNT